MANKLFAEAIGTFMLVSAVLGGALISGNAAGLGVALAIGIAVMAMAYAVGPISGGHFNPAVTLGLVAAGRFETKQVIPYWLAQIVGGVLSALFFAFILSSKGALPDGFASNGYGEHSPGGYSLLAALVTEVVMTMMFLLIILGATSKRAPAGFAPLAIGLGLTLIHLISVPVTNTSVNPARSLAPAVFVGGWALKQVWLFWLAPIAGAIVAGIVWSAMFDHDEEPAVGA